MCIDDLARLRILSHRIDGMQHGEIRPKDGEGRETTAETLLLYRKQAQLILSRLSMPVMREGCRTSNDKGNQTFANFLLNEIKVREKADLTDLLLDRRFDGRRQ